MTLRQLQKLVNQLAAEHGPNTPVCVSLNALKEKQAIEEWNILPVDQVETDYIVQADGDGYTIHNKDGSERVRKCIVLR